MNQTRTTFEFPSAASLLNYCVMKPRLYQNMYPTRCGFSSGISSPQSRRYSPGRFQFAKVSQCHIPSIHGAHAPWVTYLLTAQRRHCQLCHGRQKIKLFRQFMTSSFIGKSGIQIEEFKRFVAILRGKNCTDFLTIA